MENAFKIAGYIMLPGIILTILFGCKTFQNNKVDAMKKPIYDYVEGWYDKDTERMKQGLHHLLVKRHPDKNAKNGITNMNLQSLLAVVPQYGGQKGDKRVINIEILDSFNTIATAKVVSNEYVDYVHLGYINNKWVIINVLWDFPGETPKKMSDKEKTALEKPIHDYVEGWYDKDPGRVKRGLHPDLAKRSCDPKKSDGIDQYTRKSLLKIVNKYGGQKGDERLIDIEILDVQQNIASVKVVSNSFVDYIHLCKINNKWLILNVLWAFK